MSNHKHKGEKSKHKGVKIQNLFFPNGENFKIFCRKIKKCQSSIHACIYQLTHDDIIELMIDLANNGRDVNILMDSKCDESEERKKIIVTKLLVLSGFKISVALLDGKGLMHSKFCLIDESLLMLGSANWTYQAFSNNREHISIFKDEISAKQFKEFFLTLWRQSKQAKFFDSKINYIPNSHEESKKFKNAQPRFYKTHRQKKLEKKNRKLAIELQQQKYNCQSVISDTNQKNPQSIFQSNLYPKQIENNFFIPEINLPEENKIELTNNIPEQSQPKGIVHQYSPFKIESGWSWKSNKEKNLQMNSPFIIKEKKKFNLHKPTKVTQDIITIDDNDDFELTLDDCEIIAPPQKSPQRIEIL